MNSSIGWIGTNACLFCASYSSWLPPKALPSRVKDFVSQINSLKLLKKIGTITHYKRLEKSDYKFSVLVFADASRKDDQEKLCFLSGLLFGNFSSGSVFYIISWSSQKSRRPVKCVASAETLAAGKAID